MPQNKKKLKALNDLAKMKHEALKAKYTNVPEYAIPAAKYKQNANGLTRAIIDFLKLSGHQAERISTTGRWINNNSSVNRGEWIPGTGTKGSADISATIKGRSVKIEVKIGRDRQSEHQVKYQQDIEKAGGVYLLVHNFDEFVEMYNSLINNNNQL